MIEKIIAIQEKNVLQLEENAVYFFDMNNDGVKETIELRSESRADDKGYAVERLKQYSLFINHTLMDSFQNTNMELYMLDLGTCQVAYLHLAGQIEGHLDSYPKLSDRLYGFWNEMPAFLGELNGSNPVVLRDGLFVTNGYCEPCENYRSPVFRICQIYFVGDGRLYHPLFTAGSKNDGWQQTNSIWMLDRDLPYLKENGEIGTMEKDTIVLICGISEQGNLYLLDEDGQKGYLTLDFDGKTGMELDPIVSLSGLRLTEYLADYEGFAYAG